MTTKAMKTLVGMLLGVSLFAVGYGDDGQELGSRRGVKIMYTGKEAPVNARTLDGDSDGPYYSPASVVSSVGRRQSKEERVKKLMHSDLRLAAINGFIDGDSDSPYTLSDEEYRLLVSGKDIYVCGISGRIVSSRQACAEKVASVGSARELLVRIAEYMRRGDNGKDHVCFTESELKALRSGETLVLSGLTGEIVGLPGWDEKTERICSGSAANFGSPRCILINFYNANLK